MCDPHALGSTLSTPAMPSKCPFRRQKYTQAAAYEKHLRTTHANVNIILASTTIRYPSSASHVLDTQTDVMGERPDSDYESDPEPTGREHDVLSGDVVYKSDTEVLNNTASFSGGQQTHFPGAGEAIGEVNRFEQEISNLCDDPWAPFPSGQGFRLASWLLESKVPKSQINEYFASGLGNSESVGYGSMHTLEKHLRELDPYSRYLQWFEGQVEDGKRTLSFFYRNVLDCVRYLLRQIAYRDNFVYAPRREYDHTGQRVYAEMHTADWWWDIQVEFLDLFPGSAD